MKKDFIYFYLFLIIYSNSILARDFLHSVEEASSSLKEIIAVVGVLALMVSGATFYWSKRVGTERLMSAVIGTVVFASAGALFSLFYSIFN